MFDVKEFLLSGTLMMIQGRWLLVGAGPRTWLEVPEKSSQPIFYFPDFFLQDKSPWFQHEKTFKMTLQELYEILEKEKQSLQAPEWIAPSREHYEWGFATLQGLIQSGELQKGVPYEFENSYSLMVETRLRNSLASLLRFAMDRPILPYGFWDESEGILGASPELLFCIEGTAPPKLKTMACAGTMGHHESRENFLKDPKELEEHRCVVEGITKSVKPFGKVMCGQIELLDLGKLVHLVTPIEMELAETPDYPALIAALHPTPALGTFPKEEGRLWLSEYEKRVPRKRYGAPVGVIHDDESSFYVGIRNVQWDANGMALGAGGGVNRQSVLEREWDEVHSKLGAIKEVLSLG